MPTTVWPVRKRPTCRLPCCQVAKDDNGKKLRMKYLVAKEKVYVRTIRNSWQQLCFVDIWISFIHSRN